MSKHRNPFNGEIYDDVINFQQIDIALKIFKHEFKDILKTNLVVFAGNNYRDNITIGYKPLYIEDKIKNYIGNYYDPNINKVIKFLYSMGYEPSLMIFHQNGKKLTECQFNNKKFRNLIDEEIDFIILKFTEIEQK